MVTLLLGPGEEGLCISQLSRISLVLVVGSRLGRSVSHDVVAGGMHSSHHVPKPSVELAVFFQAHCSLSKVLMVQGALLLEIAKHIGFAVVQVVQLLQVLDLNNRVLDLLFHKFEETLSAALSPVFLLAYLRPSCSTP